MTPTLWLGATIAFTLLAAFPYVIQRTLALGIGRSLGNPGAHDDQAMAPWAQRAKRAHANAVENLVLFAPAVLAAQVAGVATASLSSAAAVYLGARIVHYVAYVLGIPVIRTLAHVAGLAAIVWILLMLVWRIAP